MRSEQFIFHGLASRRLHTIQIIIQQITYTHTNTHTDILYIGIRHVYNIMCQTLTNRY